MGDNVHRAAVGAVLAVAMALMGASAAQAAWSGIDALGTGRYGHTATRLEDGRVLVAGGNNTDALTSAELYDPAANLWSNVAPMHVARHGQAAALLPQSGEVLVAGGATPSGDPDVPATGYTRTAEIYDPAANTWTQTPDMSTARFQPTMTVLDNGRVLVAGGTGGSATSLASAEIYNPATNSWTPAASMSTPRALATATLLSSGKVLVAGGYADATGDLTSAELYDPVADKWSATGSLATARDGATATALEDGDVLVAGGDSGSGSALASAELYRPDGTWHAAASMTGARQTAAAALLEDGSVLVTGGEDGRLGRALDTTERYDPSANRWTDGGKLTAGRAQHTVTPLADGRALLVGGNGGGFAAGLAGVERFSPVATTVTALSFGSRPVGSPSDVQTSVLTNNGTAPLVVTGVSIAGTNAKDFALDSESCVAAPVAPGGTCEMRVRFTPAAAGARSATLTVADNSAAGTSTAALTGSGQAPAGTPAPGGATAGGGTSAAPSSGAGAPAGSGAATAATPHSAVAGTTSRSTAKRAKATCKVKTTRRHGRSASTVTCKVTWPTPGATGLSAKLMRGKSVLGRARATARAGSATLTVRATRRLRAGRYTVVIARRNGTVVLRQTIRAS